MSYRGVGFGGPHAQNDINIGLGSSRSTYNSSSRQRGNARAGYRKNGGQNTRCATNEYRSAQGLSGCSIAAEEQGRLDGWDSTHIADRCRHDVALTTRKASFQKEAKKKIDMGYFAMASKQSDQISSDLQKTNDSQKYASEHVPVPLTRTSFTRLQMIELSMNAEAKKTPMLDSSFDKILRSVVVVKSFKNKTTAHVSKLGGSATKNSENKKKPEQVDVVASICGGENQALPKDLLKGIAGVAGMFSEAFTRLEVFLNSLIR